MKRNAAFIILLLIGILLIACQGEPKPAPLSHGESAIEQTIGEASPTPALAQNKEETNVTPELMPTPENEPKPTVSPSWPSWINPEIGKHEVTITVVSVENPNPPDDYEIKQISELPKVETEGKVSERTIQKFWEIYDLLPESLREQYETEDFTIRITKKELTEYYDGSMEGFINGIFSYERKMIFLYGTESALESAMLHEFGHYLDWKCGFPSRTDTFKELYEKENILMETNPHINDPTEFFAEVFKYWLGQNADKFPRTVCFIQSETKAHLDMTANKE